MLGQTWLQGSMAAYNYNLTLLLTFTIIRIDSYPASKSRDHAFNKTVDWNPARFEKVIVFAVKFRLFYLLGKYTIGIFYFLIRSSSH